MPTSNCLLCSAELEYFRTPRQMQCALCGQMYETTAACKAGHFVCDACHLKEGAELILEVCSSSKSRNPIALMQQIMAQPQIYMHGPEHHILVGAVLLTAYHNSGGELKLQTALSEMSRRGQQIPGGTCGFWGCCGAGVSAGIFVSIITGATPLHQDVWGLANQMTARALQAIGNLGGPRCCKRDSFTAVKEAVAFMQEHFLVQMELPDPIICGFSKFNEQCKKERCPYYVAKKV